jgi:hypothetical protein
MHVFHQGGGYNKFNFRDFRYSDLYGNEYIFFKVLCTDFFDNHMVNGKTKGTRRVTITKSGKQIS